jgi:hypothetical protein
MIREGHPGFPVLDLDFLPITDPGVKKGTASRIPIRNNGFMYQNFSFQNFL